MFNLFSIDARQLEWLSTPPEDWEDNQSYTDLQRRRNDAAVANDAAESAVKAVQEFAPMNPQITDACEAQLKQIIGIEPRYQWEVHTRLQKLKLVNHVMLAHYMPRMALE